MITAKDLNDWMEENGEDVVIDGPYNYSMDQYSRLGDTVKLRIETEMNTKIDTRDDDWYNNVWMTINSTGLDNKAREIILEEMANIINKENIKKWNYE